MGSVTSSLTSAPRSVAVVTHPNWTGTSSHAHHVLVGPEAPWEWVSEIRLRRAMKDIRMQPLIAHRFNAPSLKGKPLPWDLIHWPLSKLASVPSPTCLIFPLTKQYNITHFHASSTHPSYCYNNTNAADLIPKSTHTVLVVLQINNKDVVSGILNWAQLFLCTWFLQLNHSHALTQASPCIAHVSGLRAIVFLGPPPIAFQAKSFKTLGLNVTSHDPTLHDNFSKWLIYIQFITFHIHPSSSMFKDWRSFMHLFRKNRKIPQPPNHLTHFLPKEKKQHGKNTLPEIHQIAMHIISNTHGCHELGDWFFRPSRGSVELVGFGSNFRLQGGQTRLGPYSYKYRGLELHYKGGL